MTTIYLVRHGEAEGNAYRRSHGWYDSQLMKKAYQQQLPRLADRFRNVPIDAVYASDIFRARRTVQAVAETHGLEVIPEPGLRELYMGEWEDLTWGELPIRFPEEMDAWQYRPWEVKIPGGETYPQVLERMQKTIFRLAEKHEGKAIVLGSHGAAIRGVLAFYQFGSLLGLPRVSWCDNTAVTKLEVENGEVRVIYANDNSHLNEESSTLASQKWWRDEDEPEDFNMWFRPCNLDDPEEREQLLYYGRELYKNAYKGQVPFDPEEFLKTSREYQAQDPMLCSLP